jgi:hypothetical protein
VSDLPKPGQTSFGKIKVKKVSKETLYDDTDEVGGGELGEMGNTRDL